MGWLYELLNEQRDLELEILKAHSAREAIAWLDKTTIDIVLTDIRMPEMNGLQLLERINHDYPHCKVIFLTGYKDFEYIYTVIQNRDTRYLLKIEKDEVIIKAIADTHPGNRSWSWRIRIFWLKPGNKWTGCPNGSRMNT